MKNVIIRQIMSEKVIVCKNMVFPEMTKIQHTLGLLGIPYMLFHVVSNLDFPDIQTSAQTKKTFKVAEKLRATPWYCTI